MNKSNIDEILLQLYLRLNGYFTTSLILHSPTWGQNRTDVDCIAIRHPYHNQPDRKVDSSSFLKIPKGEIDLIFCEVKHELEGLQFNSPLKDDQEALKNAFRWVGLFKEEKLDTIVEKFIKLIANESTLEEMRTGIKYNNCRFRALLCCPPLQEYCHDNWCLTGKEILDYTQKCFLPSEKRESCSTRYNFQQWGFPFFEIVEFLKNNDKDSEIFINDIYKSLSAT